MNNLPKVSRVEIINHVAAKDNPDYARAYVYWADEPIEVYYDLQDDNRTLKVFIEKKTDSSMNNAGGAGGDGVLRHSRSVNDLPDDKI